MSTIVVFFHCCKELLFALSFCCHSIVYVFMNHCCIAGVLLSTVMYEIWTQSRMSKLLIV
ncbi:hypothetical protein BDW69DRAFT_164437, partial [Aspergillus filifer]